jgi:hypothetical protein
MKNNSNQGLEGRDCVPFFKKDKSQITFEFFYLVVIFIAACMSVFILQIKSIELGLTHDNKLALFTLLGGFLGGWVYDAKWFYRVTARGRHDQYGFSWQPHKFYWRVMTPFLSALVAFSTYMLLDSGLFPVELKNKDSAKVAISVCFVLGYFSDLVLSRLAKWAEKIVPRAAND